MNFETLRYGRTPIKMPDTCDADGSVFDLNHALNCPKGGLVYGRHNETRDLNCNLLELAGFKQVCSEPVIVETDKDGNNGLRADWELEVSGNLKSKRVLMYASSMLTRLL